ncbi:MAG: oligosaccharide flippase family protein, partial [Cyanobacteria bacterium J06649_11]
MVFIYSLDDFNTFGFLQILITASLLLSPIFTLGVRGVILRFFPYFKDTPEQRAAFLSFAILTGFCGITVLGLVGNFVILPLLDQFESSENNVQVYIRFAYYIYCITAIQILIEILDFYIQNFRRVTVQTIFTNLLPKLTMGALVFLTYKFGFDLEIVAITVVGMNLVILLCLLAYLNHLKELRLTWKIGIHFSPRMRREIFDFALFAILGTLGNKLVLQIDTISLGTLTDEQTVGIFRFVAFAAGVIDIP